MTNSVQQAGRTPAPLSVWSLAWPTMLAMASHSATRWADMKMVGGLGEVPLAAVTVGGQISWLYQMPVIALSVGLTAIVARGFGAGNFDEAALAVRQSILLGLTVGLVIFAISLPFLSLTFEWIGTEPGVVEQGSAYLFWMLVGIIPLGIGMQFPAALRAGGDAITPLWTAVIANILNVALNWVFIYGNLGMPAMGAEGAGLASTIALTVWTIMMALWWLKGWTVLPVGTSGWRPDWSMWKRISVIGAPSAAEGLLFNLAMLGFAALMAG